MEYPEYDSPFTIILNGITTQIAKETDEMTFKAIQRAGITVDKDKLIEILQRDLSRYHEAYHRGYESGFQKRDDDIVRCKDCKHNNPFGCDKHNIIVSDIYFCADGERIEDDSFEE